MKKVITYGTFDLFHEGHYRLLERAKALGDYLIVGVTTENYDKSRGKLNVIDSLVTRIENVRKTGFADEIIIEEVYGQKVNDIQKYNIDIFAIGSDWRGSFDYLKDYCQVIYLERTKNVSSTMLRQQKRQIQRIGIIGTGRIANRFVKEARLVSGVSIQGVYNPHIQSAQKFANKYEINAYADREKFYGSVNLVYVASPHQFHYDYVKEALLHHKHVLCEKPLTLSKVQATEIFNLAEKENCILMEGVKTAYCPGFQKLLGVARSGKIGAVRNVEACFTKLESTDKRELKDSEYGGSFFELGSYCILPVLKLLGVNYKQLVFNSVYDTNGIDLFTKASLVYEQGIATLTCGLGVKSDGRLLISGTKGYILVESPWWKTTYFEVHYENPNIVEKYTDTFLGDGLRYEINDFLSRLDYRERGEFKLTKDESVTMAALMEEFQKFRVEEKIRKEAVYNTALKGQIS